MALVCSFDFKTHPMKSTNPDMDFLKGLMTTSTLLMNQDSFHFQQEGRITPDEPMFSSSVLAADLEPVPIGAYYKNPYHQAAQQSILKESVEFLFGSSSSSKQEEDGASMVSKNSSNKKKRKRCDNDDLSDDDSARSDAFRFRPYQNQQWGDRFEELKDFRRTNGHCSVPYDHPPNPSLARWVKRQRYQYKLFMEGQPSAMTEERLLSLEAVGFVWDTYTAAWERRISELRTFRAMHGHCNVPATYRPNKKLAAWVKCQRRQYKFFSEGKASTLTRDRVNDLNQMDFQWELRGNNKQ